MEKDNNGTEMTYLQHFLKACEDIADNPKERANIVDWAEERYAELTNRDSSIKISHLMALQNYIISGNAFSIEYEIALDNVSIPPVKS